MGGASQQKAQEMGRCEGKTGQIPHTDFLYINHKGDEAKWIMSQYFYN